MSYWKAVDSRSGKTFILLYAIFVRAFKKKSRHVVLRFKLSHIRGSIWHDTLPKLINLCFKDKGLVLNKYELYIQFPNGSQVWLGGLDDKERTEKILGTEYSTIYYNEVSQIPYDSVLMGHTRLAENSGLELKCYYDCNPPSLKHWIYKLFHEMIDPEDGSKVDENDYCSLLMNPHDNKYLPKSYFKMLESFPKKKRDRFLYGLYGKDNERALWKSEWINNNRLYNIPELRRIVVAIDPAVSSNKDSNEHGIISVGVAHNEETNQDHFYVLDDSSLVGTPSQWSNAAVSIYKKLRADRVIGERNNGGDMVKSTIKNVDNNIPVTLVWASRGKETRAEPISALYEEGRVHHTAMFDMLEDELTDWVPGESKYSPNRLDALVWGLTEVSDMAEVDEIYIGTA